MLNFLAFLGILSFFLDGKKLGLWIARAIPTPKEKPRVITIEVPSMKPVDIAGWDMSLLD